MTTKEDNNNNNKPTTIAQGVKEKQDQSSLTSSSITITTKRRSGSCYCGAITITVQEKPIGVSICHCTICQRMNGTPFGIQSLHKPTNFSLTYNKGTDDKNDKKNKKEGDEDKDGDKSLGSNNIEDSWLWSIQTSKDVTRYRCRECGSPIYATLRQGKIIVVPRTMLFQAGDSGGNGDNIHDPDYQPTHHMHYGSRILDVNDELPKYIGSSHPKRGILYTKKKEENNETSTTK